MNLKEWLAKLPKSASISEVFAEMSRWEKEAVKLYKAREKTKKSGKLHYRCYHEY